MASSVLRNSALLTLLAIGSSSWTAPEATAAHDAADPTAHHDLSDLMVPLGSLPVHLHRRAADYLELERERPGSPWNDARLAPDALPMARPGDDAPTYYEFAVVGPDGDPRGYFVLSTGRHDYPVPISNNQGLPRSQQLAQSIAADAVVTRVNFLSSVSLVAEDATGAAVGSIGGLPPRVEHAEMAWLDLPEEERLGHTHYDGVTGELVSERPRHEIELGEWSSWAQLREEYVDNYAVLLEALRRGAADDWDDEEAFYADGEGLQSGWFREVPLLDRDGAKVAVSGAGARYVRLVQSARGIEGDEAAILFFEDIDVDDVLPVELSIAYADGTSELQHFQITRSFAAVDPVTAVAAPECNKAVIRSSWNTYVYAKNGGGSTLEARGGWIGSWEIFKIHKKGRRGVALQASNGKYAYAVADGGGDVRVDSEHGDLAATFGRSTFADGTVAFRTRNGHYLMATQTGPVDARADRGTGRARFRLEYCEPTRIEGQWAGSDPIDAYRKARKYDQLHGNEGPNHSGCASGCGATAWAMVFGWADAMAARGDKTWAGAANLYRHKGRKTGPDEAAQEYMWRTVPANLAPYRDIDQLEDGIWNITHEIRGYMNDWGASGCTTTGSRFTTPHIMAQAVKYLDGRVNTNLTADYDGASIMTDAGKRKAKQRLVDKQVVAIGIGYFSHYPVAFGFEDAEYHAWNKDTRRWASKSRHKRFVAHMGWGGAGTSNVPYDAWLQGWIDPPPYSVPVTGVNMELPAPKSPPKPQPKTDKPLDVQPKPVAPLPTTPWQK